MVRSMRWPGRAMANALLLGMVKMSMYGMLRAGKWRWYIKAIPVMFLWLTGHLTISTLPQPAPMALCRSGNRSYKLTAFLQKLVQTAGVQRHFADAQTEWRKCIVDGGSEEGWHRNNASLACSFDAQWIERRRRLYVVNCDGRDLRCGRNKIIHKGGAQGLALLIINQPFKEGAADALSDASAYLSLNHHRIDQPPAVMDGCVF